MSGEKVKTHTNREITLQEETIRTFKDSLRGELIRPNDAGYDEARSISNILAASLRRTRLLCFSRLMVH